MRTTFFAMSCVLAAANVSRAQSATVAGQVFSRESGQPLGVTAVAVLPRGPELLTTESGTFVLRNLEPGELRLRFRRIGFAPKDTAFVVAANDTARIRIEMTRLVIELPATVVNGTCADRTPFEPKPLALAQLFDQVKQNAERMRLLAAERPFVFQTVAVAGWRNPDMSIIGKPMVDTAERGPLPRTPYTPGRIIARAPDGREHVLLPELSDLADTAFTNNHCLWYAGQERFESDSVIRVDFEPVPRLAKGIDLQGSIFVRVDGYQLVGMFIKLNRIPSGAQRGGLIEVTNRSRFREIATGVPIRSEWVLTNVFRTNRTGMVQTGQLIAVRWLDSLESKRDTTRRPPH